MKAESIPGSSSHFHTDTHISDNNRLHTTLKRNNNGVKCGVDLVFWVYLRCVLLAGLNTMPEIVFDMDE
ncbi:hypothetical protein BLOT_010023 [Blomia tropicalis]|nr:hypothetical protein BLOT_010023 [Blomia tropicalis]